MGVGEYTIIDHTADGFGPFSVGNTPHLHSHTAQTNMAEGDCPKGQHIRAACYVCAMSDESIQNGTTALLVDSVVPSAVEIEMPGVQRVTIESYLRTDRSRIICWRRRAELNAA